MAIIDLGKVSITWRGTYSGGTAYTPKDAVVYNNASYICIANTTGNLPTDTSYWNVMAAKGVDGTDLTSTLTTQGDILYRDGSGLQRLAAGTNGQVLKTGGAGANVSWVDQGGGAYVKIRAASFTNNQTHGSSSYTATNITDSITPDSTSNKIIITCHIGGCEVSSAAGSMHLQLHRQIAGGGYSSIAAVEQGYLGYHAPNGFAKSFAIVDSPNTTGQVDYKVYMANEGNSGTVRIGGSSAISTIILEEVDGGKYA